jgi:tetrahydromethanopterin S-methyltransferase subunit D
MDDICAPVLVYIVFFIASVLAGIALGWTMKGWHDAR